MISLDTSDLLSEKHFIELISYCMIIVGAITCIVLSFSVAAAYGRYSNQARFTKITIPAKWAWFFQELPSLITPVYYLAQNIGVADSQNIVIVTLFTIHYANRALLYPFLIKQGKPTPLHLFLLAFIFCSVNGYIQGSWHTRHHSNVVGFDSLSIIGICIFALGMYINITSDRILRNLRKDGSSGYRIPYGGLFQYVSGANYLGECIEWAGYALFARSLPSVAFAFFTVSNLGPRAVQHHKWYKEKFEDYPIKRKALLPFIL